MHSNREVKESTAALILQLGGCLDVDSVSGGRFSMWRWIVLTSQSQKERIRTEDSEVRGQREQRGPRSLEIQAVSG